MDDREHLQLWEKELEEDRTRDDRLAELQLRARIGAAQELGGQT